jgi:hypothetical protein
VEFGENNKQRKNNQVTRQ